MFSGPNIEKYNFNIHINQDFQGKNFNIGIHYFNIKLRNLLS